jgi:hypothetical protein
VRLGGGERECGLHGRRVRGPPCAPLRTTFAALEALEALRAGPPLQGL